jgi:hypothetical protein
MDRRTARNAAIVFGLLGGILDLFLWGVLQAARPRIVTILGEDRTSRADGLIVAIFIVGISGLAGGALAQIRPGTSAMVLLVGGLIGLLTPLWLAGLLLLIASLCAFLGRERRPGPYGWPG